METSDAEKIYFKYWIVEWIGDSDNKQNWMDHPELCVNVALLAADNDQEKAEKLYRKHFPEAGEQLIITPHPVEFRLSVATIHILRNTSRCPGRDHAEIDYWWDDSSRRCGCVRGDGECNGDILASVERQLREGTYGLTWPPNFAGKTIVVSEPLTDCLSRAKIRAAELDRKLHCSRCYPIEESTMSIINSILEKMTFSAYSAWVNDLPESFHLWPIGETNNPVTSWANTLTSGSSMGTFAVDGEYVTYCERGIFQARFPAPQWVGSYLERLYPLLYRQALNKEQLEESLEWMDHPDWAVIRATDRWHTFAEIITVKRRWIIVKLRSASGMPCFCPMRRSDDGEMTLSFFAKGEVQQIRINPVYKELRNQDGTTWGDFSQVCVGSWGCGEHKDEFGFRSILSSFIPTLALDYAREHKDRPTYCVKPGIETEIDPSSYRMLFVLGDEDEFEYVNFCNLVEIRDGWVVVEIIDAQERKRYYCPATTGVRDETACQVFFCFDDAGTIEGPSLYTLSGEKKKAEAYAFLTEARSAIIATLAGKALADRLDQIFPNV